MKPKTKSTPLGRDFITDNGFRIENHTVTTEDGYILCLSRLSRPLDVKPDESEVCPPKPVALFVHGLLCRGEHWCFIEADKGLPYKLFEEGYDCWLANLRGSPLSRGHVSLTTKDRSYWDFTFHEMGVFDLPAIVNHILEATGNTSLSYIGHSMGCAVGLVMLAMKPEYSTKVNVLIALAPAVYGKHLRKVGFKSTFPLGILMAKWKFTSHREIFSEPASSNFRHFIPKSKRENMGSLSLTITGFFTGAFGKHGIERERLKSFSTVWPAPTSAKLLYHGFQCYRSNKARQFNYGPALNMKVYGQSKPPLYEFQNVKTPVATFCSEGDELCRPNDVARLASELPNNIGHFCIKDETFSHIDFMIGKIAHDVVFRRVSQILNKYKRL